ncbi:MAG TPA: histidine--tRNA ligase [Bacillales bacterium]|nr:histidine--tRNA ligase [Bacillales bacterium]
MEVHIPRGTYDVIPGDVEVWQYMEEKAHHLSRRYHYEEVRTPMFEHTELFQRGVGETTDIVQKEMYTFNDRSDRSLTLRPEGTAPVVRAFIDNKLYGQPQQPTKLYYIQPMFRYERPQKGRMRQFVQFGIEAFGSVDPAIDAEVIAMAVDFCQGLGLNSVKPVINSLGDTESRTNHREALISHFKPRIHEFCSDCQRRLEENPLRILDCKTDHRHELMETAPSILEYLNEESAAFFDKVKQYLDEMNIEYVVDPTLVRGLDYYNHTAFEMMSDAEGLGAIKTVGGGGRYNGLVQEIGGPETPGIGFGLGLDRILLAMEAEGISLPVEKNLDCYLVTIGEKAKEKAPVLLYKLRGAGLSADKDYLDKKVKGQFKNADRLNAKFVAVLGDEELEKGIINVKDLATGDQQETKLDDLVHYLKEKI